MDLTQKTITILLDKEDLVKVSVISSDNAELVLKVTANINGFFETENRARLLVNQDRSCWISAMNADWPIEIKKAGKTKSNRLDMGQVERIHNGDVIGVNGKFFGFNLIGSKIFLSRTISSEMGSNNSHFV